MKVLEFDNRLPRHPISLFSPRAVQVGGVALPLNVMFVMALLDYRCSQVRSASPHATCASVRPDASWNAPRCLLPRDPSMLYTWQVGWLSANATCQPKGVRFFRFVGFYDWGGAPGTETLRACWQPNMNIKGFGGRLLILKGTMDFVVFLRASFARTMRR